MRRAGGQLLQLLRPLQAGPQGQVFTRGLQYYDAPNGPSVKQVSIEDEWYNRQRNLLPLLDKMPWIQQDTWVAPNAVVAGDVDIYDKVRGPTLLLGP